MNSSDYNRRILLCVTGMSPAIVTETLYALVVEKNFIPTEIQVITTLQGKNKLLDVLLGIEGDRKKSSGALAEFIEDYGKQYSIEHIQFDESSIHIISDQDGNPLSDIRTPEENQLASDQIVKLVGELCQDDQTALHVSIAGGRKTMGFFLGYALSLYGRKQDSLSHILVSEKFENLQSFYYPKPYSYLINDRKGQQLNAAEGKVMLAEIPWVRLGLGIPKNLLENSIRYSDAIKNAQHILMSPTLNFLSPIESRKVMFGEREIILSPRGYSLLLSLVLFKKHNIEFSLRNDEIIIQTYLGIYDLLKDNTNRLETRLCLKDGHCDLEELKALLSESRTDIRKKVTEAFSIGKSHTAYIPSSSAKNGYNLQIDLESINILAIYDEISHLAIS